MDNITFGLTRDTIAKIHAVFKKYPDIQEIIIYGSRAKGTYRPGSDVDLTLKGNNISLNTLLAIENELDDLLLPYQFDVSIYSHITDPDVIDHINRVGKVFC